MDFNEYFLKKLPKQQQARGRAMVRLRVNASDTQVLFNDRSFSCLKRIHTFQRNMASQVRKSDLGLIALEKEYLNRLRSGPDFHSNVINVFKGQKNRRAQLDFM